MPLPIKFHSNIAAKLNINESEQDIKIEQYKINTEKKKKEVNKQPQLSIIESKEKIESTIKEIENKTKLVKEKMVKTNKKTSKKTEIVHIQKEIEPLLNEKQGIYKYIGQLLIDKTTGENIIFAGDMYEGYNPTDHYTEDIIKELIASKKLNYRVRKSIENQKARTKKSAEVFTPSWICEDMINMCKLPENWQEFVNSTWLEITCGEAPFITSHYDTTTGEEIPLNKRIGILDRKMQAINDNVTDKTDWTKWTTRAFKCTYGYEFQGDNLFIARVNVLRCYVDYYRVKWNEMPSKDKIEKMIDIITWNFWQMDGLKDTIPFTDTYAKIVDWKLTKQDHLEEIEFKFCK